MWLSFMRTEEIRWAGTFTIGYVASYCSFHMHLHKDHWADIASNLIVVMLYLSRQLFDRFWLNDYFVAILSNTRQLLSANYNNLHGNP